jgi:hypothetical protein
MSQVNAPVALFVFNRPETTRRVFAALSTARPSRLFLIADGPRPDRPGEDDRCSEVRRIISAVNWPCEVETNFADQNMGCRRRVISGLDWVFSIVEEAIILEDDCLPDPSFFLYCTELLERYRDQHQIAMISGFNALERTFPFTFSYYYSLMYHMWGWATWRRAWRAYDENLSSWPEVKRSGQLYELFPNRSLVAHWTQIFDAMHDGTGPNTWDYQWVYTCWMRNWLSVVPSRNMVQNIGFGADATHTHVPDITQTLPGGSLHFPLHHPPAITSWPEYVLQVQSHIFLPDIQKRIARKISTMLQLAGK